MSRFAPATVPPAAPLPRKAHALDEPKGNRRVGVVGALLVHAVVVGVLLLLPKDLPEGPVPLAQDNRAFEIELSPEMLRVLPVPPPDPLRFVEVNPDAPENVPDTTPFVGAQNQQVAQPKPTPDRVSDTPAVTGEGRENATAIVSGQTQEDPQPSPSEILAQAFAPPTPPSLVPERPVLEEAAKAVNPLPGGENVLGESDRGVGTTVATLPPVAGAEAGTEPVKGTPDGIATKGGYFKGTRAIDRFHPQERPRLATTASTARAAPTIRNEFGSKDIGVLAYNAKWSAYGEYLQRLIDAVQVQWERLIMRSAFYPTSGSTVRVVFKLDSAGLVSEVVKVDGTGAELAQRLCVSAITERAPYGEWSEDMIALLGSEQELTFTFHYR